jgi:hypothetical protein
MDYQTTDPADVRYVVVRTETRDISSAGMLAFAAWSGRDIDMATKTTTAMAIAASATQACKIMPLMTCNPVEPCPDAGCPDGVNEGLTFLDEELISGGGDIDDTNDTGTFGEFLTRNPQWTRRLMRIKAIGPNEEYGSGVFGLLEALFTDKGGANAIREEFALGTPSVCVPLPGAAADVKTGQAQAIVQGLNVRMDLWQGAFNESDRNKMVSASVFKYPVGPNVIKGYLAPPKEVCENYIETGTSTCDPAVEISCTCTSTITIEGNACKPKLAETVFLDDADGNPIVTSMKLPQDDCFTANDITEFENSADSNSPNHRCHMLGGNSSAEDFDPTAGGNKGFNGRYGNGHWPIEEYFWVNHRDLMVGTNASDATFKASVTATNFLEHIKSYSSALTGDEGAATIDEPPSRYAVWLWELQQKRLAADDPSGDYTPLVSLGLGYDPLNPSGNRVPMPDDAPSFNDPTKPLAERSILEEKGLPQCQDNPLAIDGPSRRLLYIAIVNCMEQKEELNSGQRLVRVDEVLEAFMTQAADSNSGGGSADMGAIYVEPLRTFPFEDGRGNTVMREVIQLY